MRKYLILGAMIFLGSINLFSRGQNYCTRAYDVVFCLEFSDGTMKVTYYDLLTKRNITEQEYEEIKKVRPQE